jgi:adenine-specific DNA-methyltransferase
VGVIRGRDIDRYKYIEPKLYLIAARNGIDIKRDYPTIFRHFESFGQSFRTRGAQGQRWWNLRACNFYDDFDRERIVWIELSDKARFTRCPAGVWCLNTAYFMLPPAGYAPNFLLGVLNSRLIDFYFRLITQTSGMGVTRWFNVYVEKFPIPTVPPQKQKAVERLVDRILAAKQRDPEADTSALEQQIDQLVYALYSLTPEEIKVVEGSANARSSKAPAAAAA